MSEPTCTGWMAEHWRDDLDWAHWMFACDDDCPMEVARNV